MLTQVVLAVGEWVSSGRIIVIAVAVAVGAYVLTRFVQWGLPEGLRNWLSDRFGKPLGRSTAIAQFSQYLADLLEADFSPASRSPTVGRFRHPRKSAIERAAWRAAGEIDAGGVERLREPAHSHIERAQFRGGRSAVAMAEFTLLRELSRCHGERAAMLMWWRGEWSSRFRSSSWALSWGCPFVFAIVNFAAELLVSIWTSCFLHSDGGPTARCRCRQFGRGRPLAGSDTPCCG